MYDKKSPKWIVVMVGQKAFIYMNQQGRKNSL